MARMPDARWLGEHSPREPITRYDIVCLHTIAGSAPAHAAHFSTHASGRIDQSRDTKFRSAANLNGNHRVIAIENEDRGGPFPDWNLDDGHAVPKFTDAQVEACAMILAWAHKVHDIPLQLCPNSRPGSRGLAYHRQGIEGNFDDDRRFKHPGIVAGGEEWSEHFGKVCPGDRRINQRDDILARAKEIVSGDEVTPEDIENIANKTWNTPLGDEDDAVPARRRLVMASEGVNRLERVTEEHRRGTAERELAMLQLVRQQGEQLDALALAGADDATKKQIADQRKAIKKQIEDLQAAITTASQGGDPT
jgi:N-acetylmuramoyl-L-alanine amidase